MGCQTSDLRVAGATISGWEKWACTGTSNLGKKLKLEIEFRKINVRSEIRPRRPIFDQLELEIRHLISLADFTSHRVGFGSNQTCVFSKIQFPRPFMEFVFVETKQIVSSNSNVILTQQTCGQRSGMAAASKRRALAFYFPGARGKRRASATARHLQYAMYIRNFSQKPFFLAQKTFAENLSFAGSTQKGPKPPKTGFWANSDSRKKFRVQICKKKFELSRLNSNCRKENLGSTGSHAFLIKKMGLIGNSETQSRIVAKKNWAAPAQNGKLVDNFSPASDVTSLKTPSRHVPTRPLRILRGTQ